MKEVKGRYKDVLGCTHVYCDNTIYTISSTGEWRSCSVGQPTAFGAILTQKVYDEGEAECTKEGTFGLE